MLEKAEQGKGDVGVILWRVICMQNSLPGLNDHSGINLPIQCLLPYDCYQMLFLTWFCFSVMLECHSLKHDLLNLLTIAVLLKYYLLFEAFPEASIFPLGSPST